MPAKALRTKTRKPARKTVSKPSQQKPWPVITQFDRDHLDRIALPLGGIGTGTVSLGGRGDLRDFELMNRPGKNFNPAPSKGAGGYFALLRCKTAGSAPVTRCLEGALPPSLYEGQSGAKIANHSLPRFQNARFDAAYPLGVVHLSDPSVPLSVRVEAFNPLVPGDADASGLPIAQLRYVLTNNTSKPVDASLCATLQNFIGADGGNVTKRNWDGELDHLSVMNGNRNELRDSDDARGLLLLSDGVDKRDAAWGTMALALLHAPADAITRRAAWADLSWGDSLLEFWDDFTTDGKLQDQPQGNVKDPRASIAVSLKVPAKSSVSVTVLLAWHFPNRLTWYPRTLAEVDAKTQAQEPLQTTPIAVTVAATDAAPPTASAEPCCENGACSPSLHPDFVGNYYTQQFRDAWDVVEQVAHKLPMLERQTVAFVRAVADSDLPTAVKDAALSNLTGLRSQTTFRTPDGNPFGWEGCFDNKGCCEGSCTHVWNYENAVGFLFGDLSRRMRKIEFVHCTDDRGLMSFRVNLPLKKNARTFNIAAADGQMGSVVRAYRDWKLSGDDAFLREIFPGLRRAIEFCWIDKGWDADRDGVMEGCQHNTMDVEYFGPNPQMTIWYLAALRSASAMARHLGETTFADTCDDLATRGSKWIDKHLFNGDYYEHKIVPVQSWDDVAPGLKSGMGTANLTDPDMQIGPGCLVDQLVGQTQAHVAGLGYLIDPAKARAAMKAVFKHNFKTMWGHFNHLRTYALNGESALLMCSYPRGGRPKRPFPYFNEVMTGFEHIAAAGMLYEGLSREGLTCIAAVRDRYDGQRRSPFNEAECGHHYARAMASWTAILALTGFSFDGTQGVMRFKKSDKPASWFWSNGAAWGTLVQKPSARGLGVTLTVSHGTLALRSLEITGAGTLSWRETLTLTAGQSHAGTISKSSGKTAGPSRLPRR